MFTAADAHAIATELQLPFRGFTAEDLAEGMNIELEHGSAGGPLTDVTHDDPYLTAKIAAAHLYERPDYYVLLRSIDEHRKNPGRPRTRLRVDTYDSTGPGHMFPHVQVNVIEEPVGGRRRHAFGWIMFVGAESAESEGPGFQRVQAPDGTSFLRMRNPAFTSIRWSPARWRWADNRWVYPETGLAGMHPDVRLFARWENPTELEGNPSSLSLQEFAMLEHEYLRVLPLIQRAFA